MISEAEALRRILDAVTPLPVAEVPLPDALGLSCARTMLADFPLPGFDNSMMDGYALRAAESTGERILNLKGVQPAGLDQSLICGPGEAVRVFTGAPIPAGADAVIMQEDVQVLEDAIRCLEPVAPGENVRRAGADLCAGQIMLKAGDALTPGRLGLLASQGHATVPVHAPPKAALLTTGDELRPPGAALLPGQIYNSNGVMLRAMLAQAGVRGATAAHCEDDFNATLEKLKRLIREHDMILVSGGVSVGARDQVKPALGALGIEPEIWRVKVKPGKPFLFAQTTWQGRAVHIFGLPGNPVSGFVTFQLFVRPALLRLLGRTDTEPESLPAVCGRNLSNDSDRPHYLRGQLRHDRFIPQGVQMSHALFGLSQADTLLRLEPGQTIHEGENVRVFPF
ncbi:MAG TPA: molybdopterin molybdenumtransferase MoeA [Verrucomicrobiales bacterium]|nr:molybdopterin molybdenumtransferase MoeA [Verrucomicrobiales bacterium]HRJ08310.1 molybdopterin molybdotransferase MoeA [Prosthecobacter sp.]HRK14919.1 molybdopterin molybdotransferase MoeA [Prosthecobacter sp.]